MDLVFKRPFEFIYFSFVRNFMSNEYIIKIFKWAFIFMDLKGFSFRIFKLISPYQLITIFFTMGFDLVLKGFIWITDNNLLVILMNVTSA